MKNCKKIFFQFLTKNFFLGMYCENPLKICSRCLENFLIFEGEKCIEKDKIPEGYGLINEFSIDKCRIENCKKFLKN